MVAELHLAYITIPLLLLVLALRWLRRRSDAPAVPHDAAEREGPVGFGYKASWLALRSTSPEDVAGELGLSGVRSATWSEGVETAYDGGAVFVTPPVDGWVLALGRFGGGWDREEDLAGLSRRFGEAQLFGTHRVSGYDEWQRWVDGEPMRRYAFADEVLFDEGEREGADAHEDDEWWPDEEVTIAKAREWSVDPTTLDERTDLAPTGLLGFRRS